MPSMYVSPTTLTLRNPLPEGVDSADYYISNSPLGHSLALPGPQPREFFEDTTNPCDPPQAVGRDWAATPVARWPLGLRVSDSNGFPHEPNEEELAGKPATPDITDVEAVRWIKRHVDEQRAAQGLSRLFNDEAPGDESADEVMDVKSPPGPSGSA
ncbi:hypothetical protein PILCRDRAFT_10434 [Piloderma croceum F 1598]|uniref:Uncharacterized protein n=1 Tax=Piloderma croceum (strain F 1598) TaxID=765440 RepID=A0A0C3FI42_PILCF|nr:hypothetical protein PILCRDRAFT_10434 [Piloderma croceum F 1598]